MTANLAPTLADPESLPLGADGGLRAALARLVPRTLTQWVGLVLVVGWIVVAIIAPLISPENPVALHSQGALQGPSSNHPFGTDQIGRDILSRVFYGARATLPTGFAIVALAMVIGISVGAVAGFSRTWIDEGLMRIADIFLAFPTIILALAVAAALGPDIKSAIVAIAIALWPRYARLIRGEVLSVKEREFVQASRGFGSSSLQMLRRTILPNALPAVLFVAILDVGAATLTGATLSFLGLGTQPPTAEWARWCPWPSSTRATGGWACSPGSRSSPSSSG